MKIGISINARKIIIIIFRKTIDFFKKITYYKDTKNSCFWYNGYIKGTNKWI